MIRHVTKDIPLAVPAIALSNKLAQNCLYEMDYSTQVDLVHWVAHEHLVHAKVLNFPESIEDKMSPG